jgi:hypothetical protein
LALAYHMPLGGEIEANHDISVAAAESTANNALAMSSVPSHSEKPLNRLIGQRAIGSSQPPASDSPAELPLFRFGLRQLFWFVTAIGALLAVLVSAGGLAALGLMLSMLLVAGHVGSTALGSRLRAHTDEVSGWEKRCCLPANGADLAAATRQAAELPPCSPLHGHRAPSRGLLLLAAFGVLLGALVGGIVLAVIVGHHTSAAGIAVGAVSTAVIGGWVAFLGGNFYGIAKHIWDESVVEQRKDEVSAKRH